MDRTAPPSLADWGEHTATLEDLDRAYAFRIFGGKTYEAALQLFVSTDVLSRAEDIRNMPDMPFRYYLIAFKDFVVSTRVFETNFGHSAFSAADSFIDLVEYAFHERPTVIAPVRAEILSAAEYVAERQEEYGADIDIVGSFPDALQRIRAFANEV